MVAVINGLGLGLYNNTSLNPAGSGQTNPTLGQFGDRVYVNGRTGNLVIQQQDEFLASIGLDTALLRTYNSQGTWDGDNSDNWRLNAYQRLHTMTGTANTSGSTVKKIYADGYEALFTYQTSGVYAGKYLCTDGSGAHDTLSYNGTHWSWTDGTSATTEVYEADAINGGWRLYQCKDADGNTTTYGYDPTSGLLNLITDQSGQTIHLDYSGNNLTQIRTLSGGVEQTRVRYTYDAQNRLQQVIVDLSPADSDADDNNDSNLDHALVGGVRDNIFITTYGYDASGRVNSIGYTGGTEISFEYDGSGRVILITDGNDRETVLSYVSSTQTDITDDLGRTTSYRFDTQNRLIETLSPQLLNGERLSTQYQYDADDNIVRVLDAKGNAVDYVYEDGKLMEERDALGNTIRYTYTASNQISTRTVYRTPDPDSSGSAQPQQPLTTHYIYDGEDHLLFSITPEGGVTEYRYNANGSLQLRLTYTANAYTGNTFTEAALDAWVATADLTKLHRTEYQYDILRGQLSQQTTYAQTDSTGEGVSGTASTVQYVYDRAGRLLSTVDANNHQTVFQYDGLGRLTQTTDALNHITTTTYDDLGNRSIIEYANGLHRISTFDATGRLLSITETDDTETQILGKTRYAYDAAGRLRAVQNPNGVIIHTLYDAAGRISATIDGTGALTENIYDKNGNLIRAIGYATAVSGTSLATLVDLGTQGELESVNEVALASLRPASTANDRINHNVYDASGKLRITIDAQGYITEYRYDGTGALTETVAHGTAFPGLGDVDTVSGSANDPVAVDWTNVQTTHNPDGSITLLASGLENGQQVKIDIDLAANLSDSTVTITVLRQPEQMFPTENGSTTDTRSTVTGDDLITVNDYLIDVAQNNAYVADSHGVTTSTSPASVTNTNNRALSGVTQSGNNYYTDYSNSGAYNKSFTVKNASNVTVLTGSGSWGPVGNTGFAEGSYTVHYSFNYNTTILVPTGYGGYYEQTQVNSGSATRSYSIDDTKITTVDIPKQGATSIDFYYRDSENSGTWTALSDTSVGSNFRVTFENISSTKYYKIIYKDESGNAFAIGKGSIANSAVGVNTTSNTSYYELNASTTGSSLHGLLDMNQVGQFGADVDGTLEYVDVTVSGGGLASPITTRTYPEVLRDILGSSQGNIINLKLGTKLADGTYNVTFNGAYRSGSGHTITQILTGVTTVQIGPQQVKELTWSETSVPNISNFNQAKFFYRPANEPTAQFTELQYTTSITNQQLYFVKQQGTFKVHFIGYAGVEYEYRVEYRDAAGTLLNELEINGSGDTAVLHSRYERVGDFSGMTPSYISDTQQVQESTVSVNVENTANPDQTNRTLSGATKSGGNYYLSNWTNPGTNTTFVVRNAQNLPVMTGNASSGPVGNTSFPHGAYNVTYTYNYTVSVPTGYGGYYDETRTGYRTYTYSIIDEKLTTLNIPKQGASNIEFYYRNEGSSGGWTQVSAGMISSTASLFKVVIPGISSNQQFKVVYKDSGNQAFAQAKGILVNASIGSTNTQSELKLYTVSQSTEGSSLNGLLDMNQVGAFGDSDAGDLHYIDVVVSGNGYGPFTTRTYPEAVRDLTGNNRIYLSFDELPNGRYNIEVYAKYYNNPDAQRILPELTSIQIGQKEYHQQTLSWPESAVENIEDVTAAGFFYRPAGSAANVPFAQVRLGDTTGELSSHFIRENGRFSVQLFDLQQTQYEYFVKYWDSSGQLLSFIDPAAALPTFTVNGAASTNVEFSHHVESTAGAAGSRLDGYLSATELAEIDYLSVDVINDVTGIPYRENVITIPHLNSANAGDLNLTTDAPLPEGRYRIVVTRYYKDGADGVARPVITMPAFIHEIGMKPVAPAYNGDIEEQGNIISLRFAEHLNRLPSQLSGNQALTMALEAIADELSTNPMPSRIYRDENGLLVGVLDTSGTLVNNADTAADIAIDNNGLQFDWETFLSSSANTEALLTGLANGQQIQLALNLAQGISDSTVDITIQRPADNDYASDSSATSDTRAESTNSLSVSSAYASVPDYSNTTAAYHADAANISLSTVGATVTNTNNRTLSGVTQSGSNYYTDYSYSSGAYNKSFTVKNASNVTVMSGSGSSTGPVGNTGFAEGSYTVHYSYNYDTSQQVSNGYGGYYTQYTTHSGSATRNYSIDDTKITTIDIPKQGANNILFYHRNNENSGSWTSASVTDNGSYFRVTFSDLSATKYYKIVYRNSSNTVLAMGKGSIANSAVGVNTTSNTSYYALNGSSGASLYGQLTMSEVGEFGADVDGTLDYVDVTVSGGGLGSPITTRTYPELARDLSGLNSGNVLNLRLGQTLANGTYSVSITKYYRSGSGHTTNSSSMNIQVGPVYHNQQTLSWSGTTLQNLGDIASGTFYYRPAGSSGAFTQLQMVTSTGGASSYFLKDGNNFSARVFDVALGDYEYYVMYRDADGRLVDYINPQGTLPTFNVGTTNSANVAFNQLDYDSSSTTGTRALGYLDNLTAPQLAAIDYLSVNVIALDYQGNVIGPYRQNVLTVPGIGAGSNTDLNLTIDGALPEGRYRIDVTTHYKPVNGSIPASQSTNFIHEVGIQTVAEYSATVDLQLDDIFVNFTTPVNGAHLPTGFDEEDFMMAVVDLIEDQFTTEGQAYLEGAVFYQNSVLTGKLHAAGYGVANATTVTSAILDWENLAIPADDNGGFNVVLEEVDTDRVVEVKVDLAADPEDSTAQVNVLRQPEQLYEFDSYSRLDTRAEAGDAIVLQSAHSTVTSASESSPNHFADAVNVQKSSETLNVTYEGTQRKLYGITQSGSNYLLSNWSNPGTNTTFVVRNSQNQTVMTGGASSGPVGNTGFPEGTYRVTYTYNYTVTVSVATGYGGYYNQTETRTGQRTYSYTIDDTNEIHLNIPKAAAYAGFDFQYRNSGSSGDWKTVQWSDAATTGDRIKDMVSYYRATVDLIGNSNNQEFRIYYKDGQSNIVRLGKGVLENPASAGAGVTDLDIYSIGSSGGSTLHNILDTATIGAFGGDIDGTYEYIEAHVVGNGVDVTTITYPEVVRHLLGLNEGRLVNLSLGQPLADGTYSIVITGYARDGEDLIPVELLNQSMQIGLAQYDQQTITWPEAGIDNIGGFSRAKFFYRPATSQGAFTAVEFDASPEDARTYFTRNGANFKVNLFDLDAGSYQYYVKYWDASGLLLNTIGDPQNPGSFTAGAATQTLNTEFSYNVDTTATASGTRLIGYLQSSELATIDHVSVDVFDLQTNQYYRQNVLTIPHVESSYPTDLNLTADTPLQNGRYRIEVTKYYKDDANGNPVAPVEASFIHEVGLQTVVTNTANVSVSGDIITVSFSGNLDPNSNDELAGAINLQINRANGTAVLNALDMEAGIYRYRQQVTYGDVVLSESSGRFAAYAGATPEVELVEKYYGRDKVVAVTVTDDLTESTRGASPLPAYDYANTAQGVRIQSTLTVVEDGLTVYGRSGHNPVITWSSSHRPDGAGTTVFRYKRVDQNIERAVSVVNTAGEQSASLIGILPGTYTYVLEYRNGDEILKTGTGSFTVTANLTGKSDIVFEQYIEVADSLSGISLIPKNGISVNYPVGTNMIHAWVVDTATGEIVNSADGSPAVTDVADGYDGRINLRLGEGGIPAGRYDIYVQFFTTVDGVSQVVGDAPPPTLLAQSQENQQYQVNTGPFSLIGDTAHAWFYDADSGELLYSQDIDPSASSVVFDAANYGDGNYRVRMTSFQSVGTGFIPLETFSRNFTVDSAEPYRAPYIMGLEVGTQSVYTPSTEVRWDASQRPKNTDVYFRYKAVAETEYDPQNLWIRATASRDSQGDYYVRFPQVTPDGKQQLDPLVEGQYDYVIIYVDRQSGQEVESASGRFVVAYESTPGNATSRSHEIVFGADSEVRRGRKLHDANGQLTGELDAAGYLTEYVYDAGGRLIRTVRYATETPAQYRLQGTLAQLRPQSDAAKDLTTHYFYDNQGRQTGVQDAEGYLTVFSYDAAGNLAEEIRYASKANAYTGTQTLAQLIPTSNANDRSTAYTYTALNQVQTMTTRAGATVVSTTEYEYDVMGNRVRTTAALNSADERSTWSGYDLQNRLVHQVTGEGVAAFEEWQANNPGANQSAIDAQLAQIIDTYGLINQYDAANQLINREDQNGHISRFYYDASGRIVFEINAAGEIVERVYDNFGQMIQSIQYAARIPSASLSSYMGGLLTQSVRNNLIALRDAENDSVVQQAYDARGLVISRTDQLGYQTSLQYNAFGEKRFERETLKGGANDGYLYETEYLYDSRGLRTNILNNTLGEQFNQGFDYDAFGRTQASYTYGNSTDGVLYSHYFNRYDRLGRTTETLEVLDSKLNHINRIAQYSYDAFNRKLTQSDANGKVTEYVYNDAARSMTITTPEGVSVATVTNVHGEKISVTDGNGYSTGFEYDKNGRLVGSTDGEGNVRENEYDNAGRLIFTTDAEGHRVQNTYDAANRVLMRTVDPSGSSSGVGLNLETSYKYDAKGQLIETVDPQGVITQTRYDNKGQVISVIVDAAPAGATEEEAADYLNLVTNYTYDGRGRRLSVEQGGSNRWVTEIDAQQQEVHTFLRALRTTHYEYDIHGRLIREIADPTIVTADPDDVEHTFEGLNIVTQYGYDAAGNRASVTNALGFTTEYVYDQFGRVRFTLSPVGAVNLAGSHVTVVENRYDAAGNLVQVIQYAQPVTKQAIAAAGIEAAVAALDAAENRVTHKVYDADNRLAYSISPQGAVTEFRYDGNNNIVSQLVYPQPVDVTNGVPAELEQILLLQSQQELSEVRQSWSVYDANGRAVYNVNALGFVTANDYDGNGNLLRSIQYATAVDTVALQNSQNMRAYLATTLVAGNDDRVTRYAYDAAGRLVYTIDAEGYLTASAYNLYEVDAEDGLVVAASGISNQVTQTIRYADPITGLGAIPTLEEIADRLEVLYAAGPGTDDHVSYTLYDNAGRAILTLNAQGHAESFVYDQIGNRIQYTNGNGAQWNYVYDAANRLVEERSPEVDITRLDATVWEQSLDTNLSGLAGTLAPNGETSSEAHRIDDGRLTLRNTGIDEWLSLAGNINREFSEFEHHLRFEFDITLGAYPTQIRGSVGASNLAAGDALRYHRLLVEPVLENGVMVGKLYAEYRYQNENGVVVQDKTLLGDAVAESSYLVEVASHTEIVDGIAKEYTTLYVYQHGQSRDEGYSDKRLAVAWTHAYSEIRNYTGLVDNLDSMHINGMREMLPRERAMFDEGISLGDHSEFESIVTRYEYNVMGDVTARIEAAGTEDERRTEYSYDALNRQVATRFPTVSVYAYGDAGDDYVASRTEVVRDDLEERTYFDIHGNAIAGVDVAGNDSYKVYDSANRLKYEVDANGYVTERIYNTFGEVEQLIRYAVAVNLTPANISDGLSLSAVQTALAQLPTVENRVLTTEYDLLGRATLIEQPAVTVASVNSAGQATLSTASPATKNEYNAFGQVIKQSTLANGARWIDTHFYYDQKGNRIGQLDAKWYLTVWSYDDAGNVTRQIEYARSLGDPAATGNEYNPANFTAVLGKVQAHIPTTGNMEDTLGTGFDREVAYEYDHLNRVISKTQVHAVVTDGDSVGYTETSNSYSVNLQRSVQDLKTLYTYDAVGNQISETDAKGNIVFRFYDALGRVTGQTEVTRAQQQVMLSKHNPVLSKQTGKISWARPPIGGLQTEVRVRVAGKTLETDWVSLTVQQTAYELSASLGTLPSDRYEYQIRYTRVGETGIYAETTGTIDILGTTSSGSTHMVHRVLSDGDTLKIYGRTENLSHIVINGNNYYATSTAGGAHTFDLSSLARGNYTFTTVRTGEASSTPGHALKASFQKTTGNITGGSIAIQTVDIELGFDIEEQMYYKYNSSSNNPRWRGENILVVTSSIPRQMGANDMRFDVTLEFINEQGKTTERTFSGYWTDYVLNPSNPDKITIRDLITNDYIDIEDSRYMAKLNKVVSFKLSRTDGSGAPIYNSRSASRVETLIKQNAARYALASWFSSFEANESPARKRELVLEATGHVDTQQLEFINLPANTKNAVFEYRLEGIEGSGGWARRSLDKIGSGHFATGNQDIPAGKYEYRIRINGSSTPIVQGHNLTIGKDITANTTVSMPEIHQTLSFDGLSTSAQGATLAYRLYGTTGAWSFKSLALVEPGVFATNSLGMKNGIYEYQVFLDGSETAAQSDNDLLVSNTRETLFTPLTTYKLDIFGNQVKQTEHVTSATFNADGTVNILEDDNKDRTTYNYYDYYSRKLQTQDAMGHSRFFSYDIKGNLAKEWQWTKAGAGSQVSDGLLMSGNVYRYNAMGQQIETIQIAETMSVTGSGIASGSRDYKQVKTTAEYNSFGEVTQRRLYLEGDDRIEYYQYDNAGRVWRTNDKDGVGKIYLYDVQGNVVQVLTSQTTDLNGTAYNEYNELDDAVSASGIRVNSQYYDDLGNMVTQLLPGRVQNSVTIQPSTEHQYDRWGNIVSQIQSGTTTQFKYDQFNNLLKKVDAAGAGVEVVSANASNIISTNSNATPTTHYHYDELGRAIGIVDANGNVRANYLDQAGQTVAQIAGDGGVKQYVYNIFGEQIEKIVYRGSTGSNPNSSWLVYDLNGRLLSEYAAGGGETHYTYDEVGNRTSVSRLEKLYSNGSKRFVVTLYRYDNRGNLIEEIQNEEFRTYSWKGALTLTADISDSQERRYLYDEQNRKVLEQWESLSATWTYDGFGRLTDHDDFGNDDYDYSYNAAGQLTEERVDRSAGTGIKTYQYYADGLLMSLARTGAGTDNFEYDASGHVTRQYGSGGLYDTTYTYDALGRLLHVHASSNDLSRGSGANAREYYLDLDYQYDAVGNRRSVIGSEGWRPAYTTTYTDAYTGQQVTETTPAASLNSINQWYTYDGENRVLISRGHLASNAIVLSNNVDQSVKMSYDKAGNKTGSQFYRNNSLVQNTFIYDLAGNLIATSEDGQLTSERTFDLLGRQTEYIKYSSPGSATEQQLTEYFDNGQQYRVRNYVYDTANGATDLMSIVQYSYDSMGNVAGYTMQVTGNGDGNSVGDDGYTNTYDYDYIYQESALVDNIAGSSDPEENGPDLENNTVEHHYDIFGNLTSLTNTNSEESDDNRSFIYNASGQMLEKKQVNKYQHYYYHNGQALGNGGHFAPADFDFGYKDVSEAGNVASTGSSYTVRPGDTLQSIAMAVYGDSQFWYLIADANGISGDGDLEPGQSLRIPGNINTARNSTDTFRAFALGEAIGNTSPDLPLAPPPPVASSGKNSSNPIVAIIAIVVAVVVTIFTAGAAAMAMGATLSSGASFAGAWAAGAAALSGGMSIGIAMGAAAIGGAVGNIASQAVQIIGGNQEKFDWKGVASGALTAAAGAGIGNLMNGASAAGQASKVKTAVSTPRLMLNAAVGNVANQGINIALGVQEEFSWAGLATAAITAGISNEVELGHFKPLVSAAIGHKLQEVETGQKLDWGSTAVNAFGQMIGNAIVERQTKRESLIDTATKLDSQFGPPRDFSKYSNKELQQYVTAGLNALKAQQNVAVPERDNLTASLENNNNPFRRMLADGRVPDALTSDEVAKLADLWDMNGGMLTEELHNKIFGSNVDDNSASSNTETDNHEFADLQKRRYQEWNDIDDPEIRKALEKLHQAAAASKERREETLKRVEERRAQRMAQNELNMQRESESFISRIENFRENTSAIGFTFGGSFNGVYTESATTTIILDTDGNLVIGTSTTDTGIGPPVGSIKPDAGLLFNMVRGTNGATAEQYFGNTVSSSFSWGPVAGANSVVVQDASSGPVPSFTEIGFNYSTGNSVAVTKPSSVISPVNFNIFSAIYNAFEYMKTTAQDLMGNNN